MTDAFEDHSRRTTILATLGVAAGVGIMVAGLSLSISSLGGLWPFPSSDGASPPQIPPPTEADEDGTENDEVVLAPFPAVAIRSVEGSVRPLAAGVRGADAPPDAPPDALPTPTTDEVETTLSEAEEAATAPLDPVIDVDALREWLLPPAREVIALLPALDLVIV